MTSCIGRVASQSIISSDEVIKMDFVSQYDYEQLEYYFQDSTITGEKWSATETGNYDSIVVLVTYYPPDYIHTDSSFNLIDEFISSTNPISENYELVTMRYEWIDNYPGIQFRLKNKNDKSLINKRSYLIGNRLLEIQYSTKKWFIDRDDDIYDSIKLLIDKNDNKYDLPDLGSCSTDIDFDFSESRELYVPSQYGLSSLSIKMNDLTIQNRMNSSRDVRMEMISIASYGNLEIDSLDVFYKESIDGMVNATNGKLLGVESKTIRGIEGRQVEIFSEQIGLRGKYYVWLDGKCVYTIGVLSNDTTNNLFTSLIEKIKLLE